MMRPLDQTLGFGVPRAAEHHLDPERSAEGLRRLGELAASSPPSPDRGLPVPDESPRHRAELTDELPLPGEQVLGLS